MAVSKSPGDSEYDHFRAFGLMPTCRPNKNSQQHSQRKKGGYIRREECVVAVTLHRIEKGEQTVTLMNACQSRGITSTQGSGAKGFRND